MCDDTLTSNIIPGPWHVTFYSSLTVPSYTREIDILINLIGQQPSLFSRLLRPQLYLVVLSLTENMKLLSDTIQSCSILGFLCSGLQIICLSFCTFSFGHCSVRPHSVYGFFWLPLQYLKTCLTFSSVFSPPTTLELKYVCSYITIFRTEDRLDCLLDSFIKQFFL